MGFEFSGPFKKPKNKLDESREGFAATNDTVEKRLTAPRKRYKIRSAALAGMLGVDLGEEGEYDTHDSYEHNNDVKHDGHEHKHTHEDLEALKVEGLKISDPALRRDIEDLEDRGFRVEAYLDTDTNQEVLLALPRNFGGRINLVALGDYGRIKNKARGLLRSNREFWNQGDDTALMILGGDAKKSVGEAKYNALYENDNAARLMRNAQRVARKTFKELKGQGYSRGGWAIDALLASDEWASKFSRIMVNDSIYRERFLTNLSRFAGMPGKRLDVVYTSQTKRYARRLEGLVGDNPRVRFFDNVGKAHGAMYGKYMKTFLRPSRRHVLRRSA